MSVSCLSGGSNCLCFHCQGEPGLQGPVGPAVSYKGYLCLYARNLHISKHPLSMNDRIKLSSLLLLLCVVLLVELLCSSYLFQCGYLGKSSLQPNIAVCFHLLVGVLLFRFLPALPQVTVSQKECKQGIPFPSGVYILSALTSLSLLLKGMMNSLSSASIWNYKSCSRWYYITDIAGTRIYNLLPSF